MHRIRSKITESFSEYVAILASYYIYFVANHFNVLNYKLQKFATQSLLSSLLLVHLDTQCATPFKLKLRHHATVQAFKHLKTNAWITLTLQ